MTFKGAWAFQNEDRADLLLAGWQATGAASQVIANSTDVYTYTGSPTRYSIQVSDGVIVTPPAPFQPTAGHIGQWSAPVRFLGTVTLNKYIMRHSGVSYGYSTWIRTTSTQTLGLYVGNVLKGTSQVLDLSLWHYITLKSDMSTQTNTGEMWIDGVQEATGSAVAGAAQVAQTLFYMQSGGAGNPPLGMLIGGLACWSAIADTGEVPMYCTNVNPTADGTDVGTWVSTEATDWQAVEGALNVATKTTEAAPATLDRVNLTAGTIASQIGISPATIAGVSLHTWSTGESIDAKAIIGDGAAETVGSPLTIDAASPTYVHAAAPATPTGPAWTGASLPELNYEIA